MVDLVGCKLVLDNGGVFVVLIVDIKVEVCDGGLIVLVEVCDVIGWWLVMVDVDDKLVVSYLFLMMLLVVICGWLMEW